MKSRYSFAVWIAATLLLPACSGTKAGNPKPPVPVDVELGPDLNSQLTDVKLCANELTFVPSDGNSPVTVTIVPASVTLGSATTPVTTAVIPQGIYSRVESKLSSACGSGKSIELSNSGTPYDTADEVTLKFSGSITVSESLSSVTLEVQPILNSLVTVSAGSQIKVAAESALGNAVPWNDSSAGIQYVATVLADAPLAYYRFEDSVYLGWDRENPMSDSSGNLRHGGYNGTAAVNLQPGAPIGSDNFSNSFGWAPCCYHGDAYPNNVGNVYNFYDALNDLPFTFEAWVNNSQLGGREGSSIQPIVSRYHSNNGRGYIFGLDAANRLFLSLYSYDGASRISRRYSVPIAVGSWAHVAATYDGSESSAGIRLYINGVRVDDQDDNLGVFGGMTNFIGGTPMIGGTWDYTWFWFGNLDEVAVYGSVLSPARVAAHFSASQ